MAAGMDASAIVIVYKLAMDEALGGRMVGADRTARFFPLRAAPSPPVKVGAQANAEPMPSRLDGIRSENEVLVFGNP